MDWQGKWIFKNGDSMPRNLYWAVRKEFDLQPGFSDVTFRITADSRYSLWVNGKYIDHGPVRAFTEGWRYDTYDISSFVREGANVVAVLVQSFGESNFQYLVARGGLIAEIEDGCGVVAATDESWVGLPHQSYSRHTPRISCMQAWVEEFDARVEPVGWTEPGFDDSRWEKSVLVGEEGCEPWGKLRPRDIPFLTKDPIPPTHVMQARVVRPPKQTWSIGLRAILVPEDRTASRIALQSLLATVAMCSEPMTVTIECLHYSLGKLVVDGRVIKLADNRARVRLSAGEHLIAFDMTDVMWHGWYPTIVMDYDKGDLALRSPLGEDAEYPFALVGPDIQAGDPIFRAKTAAQVAAHPKARPVPVEHTSPQDVFSLTARAHTVSDDAQITESTETITISPVKGGDTEIMLDFGAELAGFIEMDIDAPEGVIIDFNAFENIQDGQIQWTNGLRNVFRYVTRAGRQSWRSVQHRGFRYATLTLRFPEGFNEPVSFRSIRCLLNTFPYTEKGRFECSDSLLNEIWEISRRTVRLCSDDTFVDCPSFEQTFYTGDARNESLFSYTTFGDYRLARRCLLLGGESLRRSPIVESNVPSGWRNIIPNWGILWAIACEEHHEYTGDRVFLEEVYPFVRLQNFNIRDKFINSDGLFEITAWNFMDWAPMDTPDSGVVSNQSMWQVEALRRSAKLADVLGISEDSKLFLQWAEELKDAINSHLWDEKKKSYIDSIHADGKRSKVISQQTQTVAYLCDIVPDKHEKLFEGYLTDVPRGWVTVGSAFMYAVTIESLDKAGERQKLIDLIRQWWGLMVKNDATTCWETFAHKHEGKWNTRSYCHAWSAAPAFALPSYVLGVRPIEPGFAKFEVKPFLGDLKWARGAVPTPYGEIEIDLRAEGESTVTVPKGTIAVIYGREYHEGVHSLYV